jgi:UDP-N-acetylglucosamine 1-carboxyvinyltransferase
LEAFKINSGNKLHGDVVISGAKNAALPILLATILAESTLEITNVPKLNDIETSLKLLTELGADVSWSGDNAV